MQPPSKREVMLALLESKEARVHLDARKPGVVLPPHLLGQGHVLLDYGYHFTPPIQDLTIDEDGVHATLSFNRRPFQTFVPWAAVYLIADFDGNGAVWQEDIPAELLERCGPLPPQEAAPETSGAQATPPPAPRARPAFSVVPCSDEGDADGEPPPGPPGGDKPRGGHLKLVK